MPSLVEHWRRLRARVQTVDSMSIGLSDSVTVSEAVIIETQAGSLTLDGQAPTTIVLPDVLLQAAVVVFGDRRAEGQVISGLSVAWFEIIAQIERDPDFMFRIPWRKLEEIIA